MKSSERFDWALDELSIEGAEQILEIGCGTGILADRIARRLTTGRITGIDRSKTMIEAASKKNGQFCAEGKARFIRSDFSDAPLTENYDKILAFNVSVFWKQARRELEIIGSHLKSGGKLYLFYRPPATGAEKTAELAIEQLAENGFLLTAKKFREIGGVSAFCLVSAPVAETFF